MVEKDKVIKAYNKWISKYAKLNELLISEVGNIIRKYENREHRCIKKIVKNALDKNRLLKGE